MESINYIKPFYDEWDKSKKTINDLLLIYSNMYKKVNSNWFEDYKNNTLNGLPELHTEKYIAVLSNINLSSIIRLTDEFTLDGTFREEWEKLKFACGFVSNFFDLIIPVKSVNKTGLIFGLHNFIDVIQNIKVVHAIPKFSIFVKRKLVEYEIFNLKNENDAELYHNFNMRKFTLIVQPYDS